MEIILLGKGILIGIAVTVPFGPVMLLCIQRMLTKGRLSGVISGLGSTAGDLTYAAIACFGLYSISGLLLQYQTAFRSLGAILLLIIGIKIAYYSPRIIVKTTQTTKTSLLEDFTSTLLITLANPLSIGLFSILFAGFHIDFLTNMHHISLLLLGIATGAVIIWLCLAYVLYRFQTRLHPYLIIVNKFLGFSLILCGILLLSSLILV